ncbi:hypothetical protein [Chryseobacterium sp. SIMBA_028]|uniref:hypothetical protein n=1 Tax=Chryseobacterium sp. SIMBA_028 TaxID=3085771 RepID=UPI00397DE313
MKRILLFAAFLLMMSCHGQNKPIGELPLDLENFDFATRISMLFPEKNKSKTYENAYELKGDELGSIMFQKDTTYVFSEGRRPLGYEYRQINWSSDASLAVFRQYSFQKVNIATTTDGAIKVINAVAHEITSEENNKLLKLLSLKYGTPKKLKGSWKENLEIFEWIKKDRIIRFVTVYDNEKGTLKIEIEPAKRSIAEGKKNPHLESYLFIINSALKNEVFGKLNTGDFVYLNNE